MRTDLLARVPCLVVFMRARLYLRAYPYSFRLPLHHDSDHSVGGILHLTGSYGYILIVYMIQ